VFFHTANHPKNFPPKFENQELIPFHYADKLFPVENSGSDSRV